MAGRRDAVKGLAKRLLGFGPKAPEAAEPVYRPPPRDERPGDRQAELGDLWAVRYALDPQGKPLVVNHWATWCDGCMEEMPQLVALHRTWGAKVPFIGVSWELFVPQGGPEAAVRTVEAIQQAHGLPWKTIVFQGEPGDLFRGLELPAEQIPQTFVLDGDGKVRFHHLGALGGKEVAEIEKVLGELTA